MHLQDEAQTSIFSGGAFFDDQTAQNWCAFRSSPTTIHDNRLTHINWIEKLCPDASATTLKEHVGHSAQGVTEVNYTRPISPSQAILRKSLDNLF